MPPPLWLDVSRWRPLSAAAEPLSPELELAALVLDRGLARVLQVSDCPLTPGTASDGDPEPSDR